MTTSEARSRAGRVWALVPAALLGSMLLGLGTLAYVAMDDPGFSLEPNYYDKAVNWDRSQAELRESERSGVSLELAGPLGIAADGSLELELEALDRHGAPLQGADLRVEAFPNAFASRVQHVTLRETAPGVYRGRLSHAVSGIWELRCALTREALRYRRVLRADAVKGPAA